jgi:signal transduction histidine kinase
VRQKSSPETNHKTIRSRLAGVVVVPSVVLLAMWALFSAYTVYDGFYIRAVAASVKQGSIPAVNTFVAIQEERQLTMTALSESSPDLTELRTQRQEVDEAVTKMDATFADLASNTPPEVTEQIARLGALLAELPERRAQVEASNIDKNEIYDYYNGIIDAGTSLFGTQARIVPDSEAAQGGLNATDIFRAADWMARASSIASGSLAGDGLTQDEHLEFVNLVGSYHSLLGSTAPFAQDDVREGYQELVGTPEWDTLVGLENQLISDREASIQVSNWLTAANPVSDRLVTLAIDQAVGASDVGLSNGNYKFTTVLIGSVVALIIVLGAIFLAIRISRSLVNKALLMRLADLKKDSLALAHERLPDIVERLRQGEQVDVEVEVPPLDYGSDEIGQVADAFNAAQYTAVAAAIKEGQAREGINRVFLDIAHRNQGLVHRQLKILDKLEREEENPEQLDSLFQLDHLATRARRNAENLIILAGEQPGRQWRKPVRLIDVLRAGVAETEQYVRVKVNPVPETALVGAAVADTIHLIAELVDNATAFSSPRSQVQVHTSEVPQGVVVEIEDHGLGMSPEDREAANAMLADPPEFDAMSLKGESRLGLFVIARLAVRRGIKVELRESPYGGTLAMVLIPGDVIAGPAVAVDPADTTQLPRSSFPVEQHQERGVVPPQAEPSEDARFPGLSSELGGFWAQAEADADKDSQPEDERLTREIPMPQLSREPDKPHRPRDVAHPQRPHDGESYQRPRETQWPAEDPETAGRSGDGRPQLPRRRRQQNLAPQLANDEFVPQPTSVDPVKDVEQSAERSRTGLSAFQQGTRDARRTDRTLEP